MYRVGDGDFKITYDMTEQLNEGWVKFIRIHCKEGYIDRWSGDAIDDPNRENKSQYCINSTSTYFRLNTGRWYHSHDFINGAFFSFLDLCSGFTASEIFLAYYKYKLIK